MAASNATNPSLMRTRKLTGLAIFTAVIVVLQILCTFVRFGPFSITLALTPIVIGAAVYGAGSGAFLGFVMGLVVLITGILGWDGGTVNYLISINAFSTILLCMLKSIEAGWAAGAVYKNTAGSHRCRYRLPGGEHRSVHPSAVPLLPFHAGSMGRRHICNALYHHFSDGAQFPNRTAG